MGGETDRQTDREIERDRERKREMERVRNKQIDRDNKKVLGVKRSFTKTTD